jgi:four helix bundle protein
VVRGFEQLEVFQRAYKLSLEIHRASLKFPKVEQYGLAEQMRRASKSICANVAEGFGRQSQSKVEFQRFLRMAVGSADELRVWMRYCLDLGYIKEEIWHRWRGESEEIAKMLQGLIRSLSSRSRSDP